MIERSGAAPDGTDLRREAVWQALAAIPPGKVTSYGQLARMAGLGRGARLVGRWLGQLPEDTRLPWHRVLNSQGQLSLPADTPPGASSCSDCWPRGWWCATATSAWPDMAGRIIPIPSRQLQNE